MRKPISTFIALGITIAIYIISPLLTFIFFLFYFKDKVLEKLAKKYKGISSILSWNSEMDLKHRKVVIYLEEKVSGELNLEKLIQKFRENVILAKNKEGLYLYERLQERVCCVFGQLCWIQDDKFELRNHIRSYPSVVTSKNLEEVREKLLEEEFKPEVRCPWDLTLISVSDHGIESTILFFRFHHMLGDGHTVFRLLARLLDENVKAITPKRLKTLGKFEISLALLKFPYDMAKLGIDLYTTSLWPASLKGSRVTAISNFISLSKMKEAGKAANVSVTTVLMTGIALGFAKAPKRFFSFEKHSSLPIALLVRIPSETVEMETPATPPALIRIPIRDVSSQACLKESHAVISKAMKSSFFVGQVVAFLTKILNTFRPNAPGNGINRILHTSNFPGPLTQVSIQGYPVESLDYGLHVDSNFGIMTVLILSYNGHIRIRISGDTSLLASQAEAQGILSEIENQISLLSESYSTELDSIV